MKLLRKVSKLLKILNYDPSIIVTRFPALLFKNDKSLQNYYIKSGLNDLLNKFSLDESEPYKLFLNPHKKKDIITLYKLVDNLSSDIKRFTNILEFGCGVSTISMAYALSKQKYKGKIYACESDKKWAELTANAIEKLNLTEYCEIIHSTPKLELINNVPVSLFEILPNISPDLIYLDGPTTDSVEGNIRNLTMKGLKYIVAADILFYEYSLWQGSKIVIDGRIQNKKFLINNLKRKYKKYENYFERRTILELIK